MNVRSFNRSFSLSFFQYWSENGNIVQFSVCVCVLGVREGGGGPVGSLLPLDRLTSMLKNGFPF